MGAGYANRDKMSMSIWANKRGCICTFAQCQQSFVVNTFSNDRSYAGQAQTNQRGSSSCSMHVNVYFILDIEM